jgi:hypothetical protein
MFGMLMTEDFCWQMTAQDWRARRPARLHRAARAAWRAEGLLIEQKRERIRELAGELGLVPGGG